MTARSANHRPDAERVTGDAYYTPDAVAEALVDLLPVSAAGWPDTLGTVCLEPHLGGGSFARALGRRHTYVLGLDINEGAAFSECHAGYLGDFLTDAPWEPSMVPEWIVGNPPYRDAEAHIRRALAVTGRHVAFLLRLAILESAQRAPLWAAHPPRRVWVLSERPSFSIDGKTDSAAYAWVWWDRLHDGETSLGWVSWRAGVAR